MPFHTWMPDSHVGGRCRQGSTVACACPLLEAVVVSSSALRDTSHPHIRPHVTAPRSRRTRNIQGPILTLGPTADRVGSKLKQTSWGPPDRGPAQDTILAAVAILATTAITLVPLPTQVQYLAPRLGRCPCRFQTGPTEQVLLLLLLLLLLSHSLQKRCGTLQYSVRRLAAGQEDLYCPE